MPRTKGIIYYTDNRLPEPIFSTVQKQILKSGLPVVSVSLKPINFGKNIALDMKPGYFSMVSQQVKALETSDADYVFFCEHDVLYHKSHFDFLPDEGDVFYYNMNNWRWDYPEQRIIRYRELTSLSQLCVNRLHALNYFKLKIKAMKEVGLDKFAIKDPHLARVWGYEPGRKSKKKGAISDEKCGEWNSPYPNIDIRHANTFSLPKVKLKDFRQKPTGWTETTIDTIDGWDLRGMFNLKF